MVCKEGGIFYGWRILIISMVTICFGYSPLIVYGFSSFIIPLSVEFGWSRGAISFAFTICGLSMIAAVPVIGILLDKVGARRVLLGSTLLFGLLLCSLYFLTGTIWLFYAGYVLIPILGGATSPIGYSRLMVSWFEKRKGLVLGLCLAGQGIGAAIVPPMINKIIQLASWREAYCGFGLLNILFCLPVLYFVIRNTPEEMDTYPDGVIPEQADPEVRIPISSRGYTFHKCLELPVFWKMAAIFFLLGLGQGGPLAHLIPILVDNGFVQSKAVSIVSLLGMGVLVGRVIAGYLMDRFFAPFVAAAFLVGPAIGFSALALAPSTGSAVLAAILLGSATGAEFDLIAFFCTQYFGRPAFGRTYGTMFAILNLGGGIGVYLTGVCYDIFSSYYFALLLGAVMMAISMLITIILGEYPELPLESGNS